MTETQPLPVNCFPADPKEGITHREMAEEAFEPYAGGGYYVADPRRRAVREGSGDSCENLTESGQICAAARYMTKDRLKCDAPWRAEEPMGNLHPNVRHINPHFVRLMIRFHDRAVYWAEHGLTSEGCYAFDTLIQAANGFDS